MPTTYDLGPLPGGPWHQYANAAGQAYYYNTTTQATTYSIPSGFEDHATDTWARDSSKTWVQWNNQRTGRATWMDPNPPPPQSYLDMPVIQADIDMLTAVPESRENQFRKPVSAILSWIFPVAEGYQVTQEVGTQNTVPDFTVFKVSRVAIGNAHNYEIMMVESKKRDGAWGSTMDQAVNHFEETSNESKKVYGMVHIGLEVAFYRYDVGRVDDLSGRLHLVNHAIEVTNWLVWIKQNPLPVI
ncbi:MAG: hypothetical protein M1830_009875 [Pleopsidium flavum]|nr:MAG: hypothetical protein M1830_009875 [Pleopsidium flavum]